MKKYFSILAMMLLAAVSCQKFDEAPLLTDNGNADGTHTVQFFVEEPETKTTIEANEEAQTTRFTWENTDNSYIHLYENGIEGKDAKLTLLFWNYLATFSAKFSGLDVIDDFVYDAVIAGHYMNLTPTVPSTQYPAATSYDPAADVLIGHSIKLPLRPHIPPFMTTAAGVILRFTRENAVVRLEINGLNPGEKVEYVQFDAENNIAGPFLPLEDLQFAGYDTQNGTGSIKLEYSADNEVPEDGKFVTFFTSWPVKPGGFTLTVITDQSYYTKTVSSQAAQNLEFNLDNMGNLKTNMAGLAKPVSCYQLVTEEPEEWDGTYVITSSNQEGEVKILDATASETGFTADATVVTADGALVIVSSQEISKCEVDISYATKKSGVKYWNLRQGGKYLYDKNGISLNSTNIAKLGLSMKYYYHIIGFEAGAALMTSYNQNTSAKSYLGFGADTFSYSDDNSGKVYLYKLVDLNRSSQSLRFSEDVVDWAIAENGHQIGGTYNIQKFTSSSKYQKDLLTYSSSDNSVATIDADGKITIVGEGETVITATAEANTEYRRASASYILRINKPRYIRIYSKDEISSSYDYLIVATTGLSDGRYHAFSATTAKSYTYDINPRSLSNLFNNDSPIAENGEIIWDDDKINPNVVEMSSLLGQYFIKPVSVNKYLYCNTSYVDVLSTGITLPTYKLDFADGGNSLSSLLTTAATAAASITFDDNGKVTIRSSLDDLGLGGTLCYTTVGDKFTYIDLSLFDSFGDIDDLIAYIGTDNDYAWLLNLMGTAGQATSITTIGDVIGLFCADMYIYKYISK